MFKMCRLLIVIPNISEWIIFKVTKVTNISGLFSGCNSIISLPDISKWNTNNVIDMNSLFSGCNSL